MQRFLRQLVRLFSSSPNFLSTKFTTDLLSFVFFITTRATRFSSPNSMALPRDANSSVSCFRTVLDGCPIVMVTLVIEQDF